MVKLGPAVKRVFASVDWGYTNPGTIQVWAMDGDGRLYLVHEVYESKRQIQWWVDRAKEIQSHFKPECFVCDPANPAYVAAFLTAGLHAVTADNTVVLGINAVQQRLRKQGDGRPRLYLHRNALVSRDPLLVETKKPVSTIEEIEGYVWAPGPDGKASKEEPLKVSDHGMDAMRYIVAHVDGLGSYSAGAY
jgi:hypothetical protein